MSKEWTQRPSSLLAIEDAYYAWCIDEVVYLFGNHCEGEMNDAENRTKRSDAKGPARVRALQNILDGVSKPKEEPTTGETGEMPPAPVAAGKFRDPAAMFRKK